MRHGHVEKEKYSGSQFIVDFVLLALFCALVLAMVCLGLWAWRVTGSSAGFGGGLIGGAGGVLVIAFWGRIQTAKQKRRLEESDYTWENGCWFVVQEDYDGQRRRVGVPWRAQKDALMIYDGIENMAIKACIWAGLWTLSLMLRRIRWELLTKRVSLRAKHLFDRIAVLAF
jgi:hypothetical protein